MSNPIVIDLFVEDRAHEEFLRALLYRFGSGPLLPALIPTLSAGTLPIQLPLL